MNGKSLNLEYKYAVIDLSTGECLACATFSYEIINEAYIPVPHIYDDYVGKYYNQENETWYYDSEFTQIYDPEA